MNIKTRIKLISLVLIFKFWVFAAVLHPISQYIPVFKNSQHETQYKQIYLFECIINIVIDVYLTLIGSCKFSTRKVQIFLQKITKCWEMLLHAFLISNHVSQQL